MCNVRLAITTALVVAIACMVMWAASLAAFAQAITSPAEFVAQMESLRDEDQFPSLLSKAQEAANSTDPGLASAGTRFLGEYYEEGEDFDKADSHYRQVLEKWPTSDQAAWAMLGLAEVIRLRGAKEGVDRYGDALLTYQQVIDRWPDSEAARWARVRTAKYYTGKKEWATAEQHYLKALENPKPTRWSGKAFIALGEHFRQKGDYQQAIIRFQEAMSQWKPYIGVKHAADTQCKIAIGYHQLGRLTEAKTAFTRILEDYPGNKWCAEAHRGLATIAVQEKDYDTAIAQYEAIITGDYRTSPLGGMEWTLFARYKLGLVYYRKKDYSKALATFERAIEDGPDTASGLNAQLWTGSILREQGKHDAAVAAYQKLINAAPGGDRAILAQYYIATTLEAKGATTRAIEAYGKVLTDYPAGKQFDSWKAAADKALSRLRASAAK